MKDLNKLIGIPFKLGGIDFDGCDCRGICYLYHKYVKGIQYPYDDGKKLKFRKKEDDESRITDFLLKFCHHVDFDSLEEGDFILIKTYDGVGMLGVCIDKRTALYMTEALGSMLTKLRKVEHRFISGYRPFKF